MNLLTRYILAQFRRNLLLALGAFVGLYLLADFFEKVDNFLEKSAELQWYVLYFSSIVPAILVQVIPLAVLLATFLTVGGLSRSNELTAMRSGGMSLWRITAPLFLAGVLISLASLALSETLVPWTSQQANYIYRVQVRKKPEIFSTRGNIWYREGEQFINVHLFRSDSEQIDGLTVYGFTPDFRLHSRIEAGAARHDAEGHWLLQTPLRYRFSPEGEYLDRQRLDALPLPLGKTPADFKLIEPQAEEMTLRQMHELISKFESQGYSPTRLRVDLQSRLALPCASLIMVLLGIPFAIQKGRKSNLALGVALSIGVGIGYFLLNATLVATGYSGVIPPSLAGWSANFAFALAGLALFRRAGR